VVNTRNRKNDQILEVRANNYEAHGVNFHVTIYEASLSDFHNLSLIKNFPTVRQLVVSNRTQKQLLLKIVILTVKEIDLISQLGNGFLLG
jgi:hypothetical protein